VDPYEELIVDERASALQKRENRRRVIIVAGFVVFLFLLVLCFTGLVLTAAWVK
jgi:hypothetical protein